MNDLEAEAKRLAEMIEKVDWYDCTQPGDIEEVAENFRPIFLAALVSAQQAERELLLDAYELIATVNHSLDVPGHPELRELQSKLWMEARAKFLAARDWAAVHRREGAN